MSETPAAPWIHIGECPVCVNGLCRVRTCYSSDRTPHFYAMCDECEALWLTPTTNAPHNFPDVSEPRCPVCQQPLYGEQADWAHGEELQGTQWLANCIFDVPNMDTPITEMGDDPTDDLRYDTDPPPS